MSFGEQSGAFLDELAKVLEERSNAREQIYGRDNKLRPYSTSLTQDEESGRYHPFAVEPFEPEVITRM